MSYGLQVYDAAGTLTFDSEQFAVGCLAELVTVNGSSGLTKTYANWPGRTAIAVSLSFDLFIFPFAGMVPAIDTSLGYPRIVWPTSDSGQIYLFAVFIK